MPKYTLGARYNKDFDYIGMLKYGCKVKASDGPVKLRKLYDSFEDVNYHSEAAPLWDAIQLMEKGKSASAKLATFKKKCKLSMKRAEL
jgi:hypothetical protein